MEGKPQWINSLPTPNGVLERVQLKGRKLLHTIGMPNNKIENWLLTDLTRLEKLLDLPL